MCMSDDICAMDILRLHEQLHIPVFILFEPLCLDRRFAHFLIPAFLCNEF